MSKAFNNILKKLKDKSPNIIGDGDKPSILWAEVESPQVTYMLGGGIPLGRMIRFRGPASSGKSAFCNYLGAALQREVPKLTGNPDQNKLVYVDFERTFEKRFAQSVGVIVDDEHFVHLKPETVEDAAEILDELVRTNEVAAIIWDSDAAAPNRTQMNDEFGKATFGGAAKATSELLRKFNILCADRNTTLLWISQERTNMSPMSHLPSSTGGTAVPYYASIICRITKTDDIKDSSGSIGIEMRVRNMKNKCSIPFRDANMHLYFNGGFDSNSEYVDFLLSLGYVTQKGAYFQFDYGGEHFSLQGRQKLLDWLDNHKDVYDNWKKEIKTKLSGFVSELDSNNIAVDEETGEALDEKNSAKIEEYIKETSSKKVTRDETD